jgi:hypothetical protein
VTSPRALWRDFDVSSPRGTNAGRSMMRLSFYASRVAGDTPQGTIRHCEDLVEDNAHHPRRSDRIRYPGNDDAEESQGSLAAHPSAGGGAAHGGVPAERRWRIKGGDTAVTLFDGDRGFYSRFTGQAKRTGGNLTTYEY